MKRSVLGWFSIPLLVTCHLTMAQTVIKVASNNATSQLSTHNKTNQLKALEISAADDDDLTPDILLSKTYNYKCELNGALTIYTNADDDAHAAIRWKNNLYRLRRIETTTGAERFENKKAGLVWIGIPSKGMLMDSRHGEQLANECVTRDR